MPKVPNLSTEQRGMVAIKAARSNLALMEAAELVRKHGDLSHEEGLEVTNSLVKMSKQLHNISVSHALAGGE